MTTTLTRAQLQQYFATNCKPTQSNFTDLIYGMLNQTDDGIVKSAGNPLGIGAAGDATTSQKVLNLYANLSDANPAWTLQLNPRSNQNDSTTAHSGFSISDATGTSRLFIDASSYNVGIGTNTPQAKLDINGGANVRKSLTVGTTLTVGAGLNVGAGLTVIGQGSTTTSVYIGQDSFTPSNIGTNSVICFAQATSDEQNAGKIIYDPNWCPGALTLVGMGQSGSRAIALYDNVTIENTLTISNNYNTANPALTVSGSASVNSLTISGQTVYPKIVVIPNNHFMNDSELNQNEVGYKWSIDISSYNFTTIHAAFVTFQGFSLWDKYIVNGNHSMSTSDIPQTAYVKITDHTPTTVCGVSYCSCSGGSEWNDSVMFTLVVIGI